MPRYFSIQAYGFPGHPFPKFWDNYPTLRAARAAAAQAIRDGWRECEIYRDKKREPGTIGIERELIEVQK